MIPRMRFLSAKTGQNVDKIFETIGETYLKQSEAIPNKSSPHANRPTIELKEEPLMAQPRRNCCG